ncbi:hypothetical protein [Glycomyces paridis]|uniref:Nucleotidyltransferase domain-containing protein n=1 Tax=Glycomyces paridis TaxID=2126555 RepID=A0A4S8P8W8_9ACTN|nr:hypothetical protein [Glycomyces paridis]THV26693.1 hypothetical protein E9998_17000 [Glycomyces paridis]
MTYAPGDYGEFVRTATADPAVVGLVLTGSQAHEGLATEHSDHDLWVVLADGAPSDLLALHGYRGGELDLVVITLAQFTAAGRPGHARYALARSRVVLDRLDGGIAALIASKRRLGEREARDRAAGLLDDYLGLLYRPAKNPRDGRALAARLDAAESVAPLLDLIFTLDRRPRPYNKHLEWELDRYPLPGWDTAELLTAVGDLTAHGDMALQRRMYAQVAAKARAAGLGDAVDSWDEELAVLRGA